jgi:hypothetical protein
MALVIGFHGIFVAKFVQGLPIASWSWWKGEEDVKEDEDQEMMTDVLVDEESAAAAKLSAEFV